MKGTCRNSGEGTLQSHCAWLRAIGQQVNDEWCLGGDCSCFVVTLLAPELLQNELSKKKTQEAKLLGAPTQAFSSQAPSEHLRNPYPAHDELSSSKISIS